jgi:hypothetical protein
MRRDRERVQAGRVRTDHMRWSEGGRVVFKYLTESDAYIQKPVAYPADSGRLWPGGGWYGC